MYSKNYSLRYSDVDFNNKVKLSAILDILQEVSICHSDEMGYTREKLSAMSVAWLLSGWKIKIISQIDLQKPITAKTAITEINNIQITRKYEIVQDDECKIIASAEWFTVDTERLALARIPFEIKEYYEKIVEESNGFNIIRLRPDADVKEIDSIKITNRDLDTNKHLNNVKSAEILLDYLPDGMDVNEFQITYKKQLYKGDNARICTNHTAENFMAELKSEDNEPCVLINVK